MSIEFQVAVQPLYALVNCQGTFESDVLLNLWADIFAAAINTDRKAILVDVRELTGTPPNTMERFDHGARVSELQRELGPDIAFALVGNEPMVDPERFAEVVATNRGALARVFTEFDEAVE